MEVLSHVDVVEQMEAGSAVARISSRAARPYATDAAPPRYPHVREEASRSGLLDPQRRPRAWRTGGAALFTRATIAQHCSNARVLFISPILTDYVSQHDS